MRVYLGYPLERARTLLEEEGYEVTATQVSSRKGLPGNERRVLSQTLDGNKVELIYAIFQTELEPIKRSGIES